MILLFCISYVIEIISNSMGISNYQMMFSIREINVTILL